MQSRLKYSTTIVLIKNARHVTYMYIYIHTHTYYVLLYIYTHIHFFAFPDLNISKDQKQKSVKIRKCTGFILISTVSPAFHSDVM